MRTETRLMVFTSKNFEKTDFACFANSMLALALMKLPINFVYISIS